MMMMMIMMMMMMMMIIIIILGKPIGHIFKDQAVQEESSLTFEGGTDIYFPKSR